MPSKKHIRHRLLLDEGLHLPKSYPTLNRLHNVLHIYETKLRGKSDNLVFNHAVKEERMVVVFNIKDFRKLIRPDKPSVISLSVNLTDRKADLKMCKALKILRKNEIRGHLISVTGSGTTTERIVMKAINVRSSHQRLR